MEKLTEIKVWKQNTFSLKVVEDKVESFQKVELKMENKEDKKWENKTGPTFKQWEFEKEELEKSGENKFIREIQGKPPELKVKFPGWQAYWNLHNY